MKQVTTTQNEGIELGTFAMGAWGRKPVMFFGE